MKGHRAIGNWELLPLLDGEYVPLRACRQFKLKIQVHRHMSFSSTGKGSWRWWVEPRFAHPPIEKGLFGGSGFNQDTHPDAVSVCLNPALNTGT